MRRRELADLTRRLVPCGGRRARLEQAKQPVEPAAPSVLVSHGRGRARTRAGNDSAASRGRERRLRQNCFFDDAITGLVTVFGQSPSPSSRVGGRRPSGGSRAGHNPRRVAMAPTRTMDDTAGRAPARRASGVAAAARAPTSTIAPRAASARPVLGSSTSVNARALPRRSRDSPYTGATRAGPSKSTTTGGTSHVPSVKDATVASLLTREKERLAEEVHELRRRHASMEERLKLANAESARAATELRRRDRTIATLESAEGDGRRVARIAELEAENDAYASEVTRLAAILCFARDDDDDDAATASNESSRAEARLRAQLALGPTMGKGHADGVEDELVEAKRRAETLAARVERLERDEAGARDDARRRSNAKPRMRARNATLCARKCDASKRITIISEDWRRWRRRRRRARGTTLVWRRRSARGPNPRSRRFADNSRRWGNDWRANEVGRTRRRRSTRSSRRRRDVSRGGKTGRVGGARRRVRGARGTDRRGGGSNRANASRERSERRPEGGGRPAASAARDVASSDPPTAEGDENASDSDDEELFDDLDESWATDAAAEDRAPEDEDEDPIGEARR